MPDWFDHKLNVDPHNGLEESLKAIPAKWAVYAFADELGKPIQLLSVKNLRASIKRRLNEPLEEGSKKVDYRAVVRNIFWKRVDSHFESDLIYLEAAKVCFPDSYRKMVSARRVWFVQINPDAPFPRWTRTETPGKTGITFGPILEKNQAGRLIEVIEDLFDLCRYHNVLVQSPNGSPCAYRDMGKCPAPCNGLISMLQYKSLIHWSIDTLTNPTNEIEEQTARMTTAAQNLKFEQAEKIRQFIEGLKSLRKNEFKALRRIDDFNYITLQPGPRKVHAKLFIIRPDDVRCALGLKSEPKHLIERSEDLRALSQTNKPSQITENSLDNIAIISRHLLGTKSAAGFIHAADLNDRALAAAYKQLQKQPDSVEPAEDEGVVTELTA